MNSCGSTCICSSLESCRWTHLGGHQAAWAPFPRRPCRWKPCRSPASPSAGSVQTSQTYCLKNPNFHGSYKSVYFRIKSSIITPTFKPLSRAGKWPKINSIFKQLLPRRQCGDDLTINPHLTYSWENMLRGGQGLVQAPVSRECRIAPDCECITVGTDSWIPLLHVGHNLLLLRKFFSIVLFKSSTSLVQLTQLYYFIFIILKNDYLYLQSSSVQCHPEHICDGL